MATPTEAECITMLKNGVDLMEETRKFCEVNAKNLVGMIDTFDQAIESDFASQMRGGSGGMRDQLNAALKVGEAMIEGALRTWGAILASPDQVTSVADINQVLDKIYDRLMTSGDRIASRVFTYNAPAAGGSNVGNGTVHQLTVDERNFALEAVHPDTRVAKCIADQNYGPNGGAGTLRHKEIFEFAGQAAKDLVSLGGSGDKNVRQIAGVTAADSLLNNASFDLYSGDAATPTELTDWTFSTGTIADVQLDTTNFFRGHGTDGSETRVSLRLETNLEIRQALKVRGTKLANVPHFLRLAYNRELGGADGTLLIAMGAVTTSVVLGAQTGWNKLFIPMTTSLWPRTFGEDELDIRIALTGGTVFNLRVDDLIFVPMTLFDGIWYVVDGGATPFMRNDVFTWAYTATEAKIQRWLWRIFGRHLPHATGGLITIADP